MIFSHEAQAEGESLEQVTHGKQLLIMVLHYLVGEDTAG